MARAMQCNEVVSMRTGGIVFSALALLSTALAQRLVVADAPEVHARFTLTAAFDADKGHNAFFFGGKAVPPTICVLPDSVIKLRYVNNLPVHSTEQCARSSLMASTGTIQNCDNCASAC